MTGLLLMASLAWPAEVHRAVEGGHVDWSRGVLVVQSSSAAATGAWQDVRAIEKDALRQLELHIADHAAELAFTGDVRAGDLMDEQDALARDLSSRWHVSEARYYTSGRVELTAELSLMDWLRPALVEQAKVPDKGLVTQGTVTGVVIDARGLGLSPSVSPRVYAPRDDLLFSGASLTPAAASAQLPAVWATDPVDEVATQRAGAKPMFVSAAQARGTDLYLGADESVRFQSLATQSDVLARGAVVILVDP